MRYHKFIQLAPLVLAISCVGMTPNLRAGNFLGLGSGSEVQTEGSRFKIGANLRQGWDSNVDASSDDEKSSAFTEASLRVNTSFGDARTNLTIGANIGAVYYWDVDDDELSPDLTLDLTLNHSVTPRLMLTLRSYAAYQIEPDYQDSLATTRRSGNYLYSNNAVSATYLWTPRLSSVTRYSFAVVRYDDGSVGAVDNRIEQYASQELRLLVLPRTTAVAEYRFGVVSYEDNQSDSTSNYFLAGVDQIFTPRLRASVRGGYEFRDYDIQGENGAPYGELTLSYNYGVRSSVSWVNRYGLEQSNVTGDQSNTTFRTGLRLDHGFTGKLNGYLGAYYQNSTYENIGSNSYIDPVSGLEVESGLVDDYSEDLIELNAGMRYQLHNKVALDLGYTFTTATSDNAQLDYDRHRVYLGVGVTF